MMELPPPATPKISCSAAIQDPLFDARSLPPFASSLSSTISSMLKISSLPKISSLALHYRHRLLQPLQSPSSSSSSRRCSLSVPSLPSLRPGPPLLPSLPPSSSFPFGPGIPRLSPTTSVASDITATGNRSSTLGAPASSKNPRLRRPSLLITAAPGLLFLHCSRAQEPSPHPSPLPPRALPIRHRPPALPRLVAPLPCHEAVVRSNRSLAADPFLALFFLSLLSTTFQPPSPAASPAGSGSPLPQEPHQATLLGAILANWVSRSLPWRFLHLVPGLFSHPTPLAVTTCPDVAPRRWIPFPSPFVLSRNQ